MAALQKLADACGLTATAIGALFVKAALEAAQENGNRFTLPLKLRIEEDCYALNESAPKQPTRPRAQKEDTPKRT